MQLITLTCLMVIVLGCSVTAVNVKFTYYWIAFEEDFPIGTDYALQKCGGGTLARISKTYWESLRIECSGHLRTGQYVNGGNEDCSCFMQVPAPIGSRGNPLQQYASIAANDMPFGTKVFVRELNGIVLPNGKIHNGCVRVDDTGFGFTPNHIDFYVLRKSNYEILSPRVDGQVDITINPDCVIQNY